MIGTAVSISFHPARKRIMGCRRFGPEVEQENGQVEVQGRHFFVTLPDPIRPESIGQLTLFTYDQVQDGSGAVVQRVAPNSSTVA